MKLKFKDNVKCYEGQIVCSLSEMAENKSMQSFLRDISNCGGFDNIVVDESVKNFLPGLKASFIKDNLIDSNGVITTEGEKVLREGRISKQLQGAFDVRFIKDRNDYLYLLDAKLAEKDSEVKFVEKDIPGKFKDKEYITCDNNKFSDINLLNLSYRESKASEVKVCSTYDFETKNCVVESIKKDFKINTSDETYFRLLDTDTVEQIIENLSLPFKFDSNTNSFWIKGMDDAIFNSKDGKAILNEVFEQGEFSYNFRNIYEIIDGKLNLSEECVKSILHKYLLNRAENLYLGYDETCNLLTEFPKLFDNNPSIDDSTKDIFSELKEEAKESNKKAYKRLQAYQDLCPDMLEEDYKTVENNVSYIDYSGQSKSWKEITDEIFTGDVSTVATYSKYIYRNSDIAKSLCLIADCLKEKNINNFIVFSNELDKYYNPKDLAPLSDLKEKCTYKKVSFKYSEDVHDRYWMIKRRDGSVVWFKSSVEADHLKFNNNEVPNINTKGTIKEMTITFIKESGVPSSILKHFKSI